jgi:hypothetical protein
VVTDTDLAQVLRSLVIVMWESVDDKTVFRELGDSSTLHSPDRNDSLLSTMRHRPIKSRITRTPKRLKPAQQVILGFLGLMVLDWGVLTLLGGRLHYSNVWGGMMFAPFALLIGILVIVVAIKMRAHTRL